VSWRDPQGIAAGYDGAQGALTKGVRGAVMNLVQSFSANADGVGRRQPLAERSASCGYVEAMGASNAPWRGAGEERLNGEEFFMPLSGSKLKFG